MIAVTMIGLVAVLAVSGLAGRVVAEHRAVEDSLAQTRLYWAGMGHAAYLLSRNRQVGPCGGAAACGTAEDLRQGGTQMLAEIRELRNWRYPDIGDAYAFSVTPVLSKVANGRWQVGIGFGRPADAVEALRTAARTPALELRYCLVDKDAAACGGGEGGQTSTAHLVTSVHRGARPVN
jgi:hypothetical protein